MFNTLWLGDPRRDEFAAAADVLRRRSRCIVQVSPDDALSAAGGCDFELIVVAEPSPGYFDPHALDALRRRMPGASILRLAGVWCGGEGRSRAAPPATHYSWHAAATRLDADIDILERGACPSWGEPATLAEEERLLRKTGGTSEVADAAITIAVVAAEAAPAAWLNDELSSRFAKVALLKSLANLDGVVPNVVVWAGVSAAAAGDELSMLRRQCPHARLIALISFVRPEEVLRLKESGVDAVADLPISAADLSRIVSACSAFRPGEDAGRD